MNDLPANTKEQSTQQLSLQINVDSLPLTTTEKEIAKASQEPKLSELAIGEITVFMIGLIGRTFLNTGGDFDKNKEMIDATLDELCTDLKKYNATLSLSEIEIAFKNGWKKEYGEYYGLNNATYFGWVNAYTWGEKRLRVKKTLIEAKNKPAEEPKKSPEEIEYIMKDACLKAFDDYRRGVVVLDGGNVKYKYLFKKGLLKLTDERRKELKEKAEEKLRAEAIESKGKAETIEKALSRVTNEGIQSEARKLALLQYFQELTENEFELTDLL